MTTCLLVVDVQEGLNHPTYYGSSRSNPSFDSNLNKLLAAFRAAAAANPSAFTVIHVHHHSRWPESPLHLINSPAGVGAMACSKPDGDELVLTKDVNSAFIGTPLESVLKERGVTRLVIVGLTMEHCVTTTTRMAKNLGVTDRVDSASGKKVEGEVILVEDAVAAFGAGKFDAQTIHDVHIESIRNEFANIMSTEGVVVAMGSWCGRALDMTIIRWDQGLRVEQRRDHFQLALFPCTCSLCWFTSPVPNEIIA